MKTCLNVSVDGSCWEASSLAENEFGNQTEMTPNCPGAATKHGNHQNSVTPMLFPTKQGPQFSIWGETEFQVLPHPPYIPDLAPCECWLFSPLKTGLAGKTFWKIPDLARAVNSQLHVIIIIIIIIIYIYMAPNSAPGAPIQPNSTSTAIIIPRWQNLKFTTKNT